MKVVINVCHGGFGLSHEGTLAYLRKKGIPVWPQDKTYYLVPPQERMIASSSDWDNMNSEQRRAWNEAYGKQVFFDGFIDRTDPALIAVVEELGYEASGGFADLKVVEIPDDVTWQIEEYDGSEWVAEVHRTWR